MSDTKQPKLSKTQAELYEAMQAGVTLTYFPYMGWFRPNAYYRRSDTFKKCTAAAEALMRKGLIERFIWKASSSEYRVKNIEVDP